MLKSKIMRFKIPKIKIKITNKGSLEEKAYLKLFHSSLPTRLVVLELQCQERQRMEFIEKQE